MPKPTVITPPPLHNWRQAARCGHQQRRMAPVRARDAQRRALQPDARPRLLVALCPRRRRQLRDAGAAGEALPLRVSLRRVLHCEGWCVAWRGRVAVVLHCEGWCGTWFGRVVVVGHCAVLKVWFGVVAVVLHGMVMRCCIVLVHCWGGSSSACERERESCSLRVARRFGGATAVRLRCGVVCLWWCMCGLVVVHVVVHVVRVWLCCCVVAFCWRVAARHFICSREIASCFAQSCGCGVSFVLVNEPNHGHHWVLVVLRYCSVLALLGKALPSRREPSLLASWLCRGCALTGWPYCGSRRMVV